MKKHFFLLVLSLLSIRGFSKHIVGGEIFYDYQGNNTYKITLKIYRDCFSGGAPYDDVVSIGVFDSTGKLVKTLSVDFPGSNVISNTINNPCLKPPSDVCVEEAAYITTVNLPPIAGGYDLSYQRCCRNNSISNIINPGGDGSTYTCHIPDPSLAPKNSSPRFTKFPPVFLCSNDPLFFDHAAKDPDGDSLVYEFTDPLEGGSTFNTTPNPPPPPPYTSVQWQATYNAQYPLSSSPAMSIDRSTGKITGTPNMLGQWVIGVRVKEYRNGKFLSSVQRDFQFNVVDCPNVTVSSIPSQTVYCFGMTVNFHNNSINGSKWYWNFGDPTVSNDTSTAMAPTWTYSNSGSYTVILIANPGFTCADTAYTTFLIYPLLKPTFVPGQPQCLPGNHFNFSAGGAYQGNGTFSWNFGKDATPATSGQQNVSNVVFSKPGVHPITLTVVENGCTVSYVDNVVVLDVPVLKYGPPPIAGCIPFTVHFSDSTFKDPSVTKVVWDFGDGTFSTLSSPTHTYTQPGVYSVNLAVYTNNFCVGNLSFTVSNMITASPSPKAEMLASSTLISVANNAVIFTDLSEGSSNCWIYFGDGDSTNSCNAMHSYPAEGTYTATMVAVNQYGCKNSYKVIIESDANFWIPNTFTPNFDGKNEVFLPVVERVDYFHLSIFDRWGNHIFESNDPTQGWDGTYKGRRCKEDIYVWKVEYTNLGQQSQERDYVGHVLLLK